MLLERSVDSPRMARSSTQRWLVRAGCPPAFVADVILLVSEMVTNAVEHATSTARLCAELGADHLRLEVHDTSGAAPAVRDLDEERLDEPRARGGYGLRIVTMLADDWGWTSTPTGKSVWVEMSAPELAGPGDEHHPVVGRPPTLAGT
jgi:anti-sigma regulatory factor (Ser/Thr protein kinase)